MQEFKDKKKIKDIEVKQSKPLVKELDTIQGGDTEEEDSTSEVNQMDQVESENVECSESSKEANVECSKFNKEDNVECSEINKESNAECSEINKEDNVECSEINKEENEVNNEITCEIKDRVNHIVDNGLNNKESLVVLENDYFDDDWPNETTESSSMNEEQKITQENEQNANQKQESGDDWSDEEAIKTPPYGKTYELTLEPRRTNVSSKHRSRNELKSKEFFKNQRPSLDGNNNSMNLDKPARSFDKFNLKDDLMNAIRSSNLNNITKLQENILFKLKGNQENGLFIKASMYSNKRLIYLISSFDRIDKMLKKAQVVIVLPITEMLDEVYQTALPIANQMGIRIANFARDSIPKRLDDHIVLTTLKALNKALFKVRCIDRMILKSIIFDEFDMLVTFKDNSDIIHNIINNTNPECQRIFFSSSLQDKTLDFVQQHSGKLTILDLFNKNECFKNIIHFVVVSKDRSVQKNSFVKIIDNSIVDKLLIFSTSKAIVSELSNLIHSNHSNKNKECSILSIGEEFDSKNPSCFEGRANVVKKFKHQKKGILICQYPLGVNLDLGEVNMVINYNLPPRQVDVVREYYHRIAVLGQNKKPSFVVNLVGPEFLKSNRSKLQDHYHIKILNLTTSY